MEYLTIEEKSAIMLSIKKQLLEIDEHIKNCQSLGVSAEYWEKEKAISQKAHDKINKNPSLELIEMLKQFEECKH